MSKTFVPRTRLYIDAPLGAGGAVDASEPQAHYLLNVMRAKAGETVGLFNGRDGEWLGTVTVPGKRRVRFELAQQVRTQSTEPDVWVAFAPVKRVEFLAEKATELGAAALLPVFTQRTDISRVNVDRLRANAIEAAEQSDRLSVPLVHEPTTFEKFITTWPASRRLYFLDETGGGTPIAAALTGAAPMPCGFLTGPEGGFAQTELDALRQVPFAVALGLGPRVLRAETAALAAIACWQALLGDWASVPRTR
jgi:16S rRNA (uracil1498-N3)-methyltransferase